VIFEKSSLQIIYVAFKIKEVLYIRIQLEIVTYLIRLLLSNQYNPIDIIKIIIVYHII